MEWQPIETAPKDHSNFLGFGSQHGTCIAYWANWIDNLKEEECEGWMELGTYDKLPQLTHWMPLPGPPAVS